MLHIANKADDLEDIEKIRFVLYSERDYELHKEIITDMIEGE